MATTTRFSINGLVDTAQSALDNLDQIATSAGAWLTFDNQSGNWAVVINQSGNSVSSFDNSTILNGIRMNGAGLRDLYNGVKVNYPRTDIRDNTDFVQIELPPADRNANEVDNLLEMTLPMINAQVQAQLIGFRELKQSRVDRIVEFETDYTKIGLKAGDLIDITNEALGMTNEVYRITNLVELDNAEQGLIFQITALEYDADVYNEDDLVEYTITTENGIYTAGDIAQPLTPTITKYDKDGRPRLEIETIVPAGRVEAMEYWLATGNIGNNYSLIGSQTSTTVGVLTEGAEIVLDLDNINAANVYVKTRGINSQTSGPFSNIGNAVFSPLQVTDAIGNNTSILDSSGTVIAALLAVPALLKGLDTFLNGNANVSAAVKSSAGTNLLSFQKDLSIGISTGNVLSPWRGGNSTYTSTNNLSFTVPAAGNISVDMAANFGNSSGVGGNGLHRIDFALFTGNTHGAGNIVSFGNGAISWEDGTSTNGDLFGDLYTRRIGNINAGNYHIESSFWSNVGDSVGISIVINTVTGQMYTS